MSINKKNLYSKMLFTPRLNLDCDDIKIRMAYVKNEAGTGWIIQNLNNDGETEWFKNKTTSEIVDMLTSKFKDIRITWSRRAKFI